MKRLLSIGLTLMLVTAALAVRVQAEEIPPEAQAMNIYRAVRAQDYKAMFYLMAFTAKGRATLTTAEQFVIDTAKGYAGSFKTKEEQEVTDRIFHSIADIMVGEAVIAGDRAVVPTSARITANGQTRLFRGSAHLIKQDGVWKLDLTIDDDAEKATAQRTSELFGKPDPAP